jgi:hypothetical protein
MSEVLALRVPGGTTERLKLLACQRSLTRRRPVRWTDLVRDIIDRLLAGPRPRRVPPGRPQAGRRAGDGVVGAGG